MKKDLYTSLKIKTTTADTFRKYAKKLGESYSDTLSLMLDFFNVNGLSPQENIGSKMTTLERSLSQRINALIAIMQNIEQTQTKPTQAMIKLLFEQSSYTKKEILLEKKAVQQEKKNSSSENLSSRSELLQRKLKETQQSFMNVLERVELVNPRFEKKYLRLNMSQAEYNAFKYKLKNDQ